MRYTLTLLFFSVFLSACKHPLEIVGDGDIVSASGARDCLLEEFQAGASNCTDNDVVNGEYAETYTAIPRQGWEFAGWEGYCTVVDGPNCTMAMPEEWVALSEDLVMPPLTARFVQELTQAHNAVLMGHSFFNPMATAFTGYAHQAGFSDHEDVVFFAGGSGGAPISFWESAERNQIQSSLDGGGVSLLGLTYYPLEDSTNNFQGYVNWIEYALVSNPEVEVFLALPWSYNPGSVSPQQYEADWEGAHTGGFHGLVDALRERFPDVNIYCIPYGRATVELLHAYEGGQLSEITNFVGEDASSSLFVDDFGHAGAMIVELASLVWLEAVYGVDLTGYQYDSGYTMDLSEIAESIMAGHDPAYDR